MNAQRPPKYPALLLTALLGSMVLWALQPGWASAESVRLAWDPNPADEHVSGYIVYHGTTSRASKSFTGYDAAIDVGAATECTIEIADPGSAHYFAVAAYDASGRRSDFSEEIVRPGSVPVAAGGDEPPPGTEPTTATGGAIPSGSGDVPGDSGAPGPTPPPAQPYPPDETLPAETPAEPQPDTAADSQQPPADTGPDTEAVEQGLTPVVRSPVNGATVTSPAPVLSVYNPVTELPVTHEFQVATDPGMNDLVAGASLVPAGAGFTAWQVEPPLEDHTVYYWRARAVADEVSSPWTPVSVFTVDPGVPETRADLAYSSFLVAGEDNRFVMGDEQGAAAGVEVTVPDGALSFDSVFFVRIVTNGPRAMGHARLLSPVYDFGPYGVSFARPVILKIPFTREVLRHTPSQDPWDIQVLTYNPLSQRWETVPVDGVDETGTRLVCRVDRFSLYALGTDGGDPTPLPGTEPQGAGDGGGCFVNTLGRAGGGRALFAWPGALLALIGAAGAATRRTTGAHGSRSPQQTGTGPHALKPDGVEIRAMRIHDGPKTFRGTAQEGPCRATLRAFRVGVLCLIAALAPARALGEDTFPENTWVRLDWSLSIRPGALPPGTDPEEHARRAAHQYGGLAYRPATGETLLMDGYFATHDGMLGRPSIYGNALYGMDPALARYTLYKVDNYRSGSTPLPRLKEDWTPAPRHTYDYWTYATSTNSVYMMKGANKYLTYAVRDGTRELLSLYGPKPWIRDDNAKVLGMWRYSFDDNKWYSLHTSAVWPDSPSMEGALVYVPREDRIYLFPPAGKRIYSFDVQTEQWRDEGVTMGRWDRYRGASFLDPKRNRVVFYSGKATAKSSDCELGVFDLGTKTFSVLPVTGPKPRAPRNDGAIAYDARHDLYVAFGGAGTYTDNWVFDPTTNRWRQFLPLRNVPLDATHAHLDMVYDSRNDVFVLTRGKGGPGEWFVLRFNPSTADYIAPDRTPPTVPEDLAVRAVAGSQVDLVWAPSTDPNGVSGYRIYRDGKYRATVHEPSYTDTRLAAGAEYAYTVTAYDSSGNESDPSGPLHVVTPATPPPSPPKNLRFVAEAGATDPAPPPPSGGSGGSAPPPQTPAPPPSDAPDVRELPVPLEVHNWAGVPRTAEPVTAGIPLPAETVYDLTRLRVLDAEGNPVPAQFRPLSRWWYERNTGKTRDPSVKWVLLDFQADVPPRGTSRYSLVQEDTGHTPATDLQVSDTPGSVTVITGPIKFVVSKERFNLFDGVWLDADNDGVFDDSETVIAPGNAGGGTITAADWPEGECTDGTVHSTTLAPPERVVIEEQGPMKVTLRIEGRHFAPANGVSRGLYGYRVFITAYAGKPYIDVQYALTNTFVEGDVPTKTRPVRYQGARPYTIYSWPFHDYVLSFDLDLTADQTYTLLGEQEHSGPLDPLPPVRLFQQGGAFTVTAGGADVARGQSALGAASISDGRLGMRVAVRDFAPNWPKAITLAPNRLEIELFPNTGAPYHLDHHTRKNHRMRLEFFAGGDPPGKLTAFWERTDAPLRVLAPVTWYRNTRAWDGGFALAPGYSRLSPDRWTRMEKASTASDTVDPYGYNSGWTRYGYLGDFNGGGDHWNLTTRFGRYLMTGDPKKFEYSESRTLYFNDMVPVHTSSTRWDDFHWMLNPEEHLNDYSMKQPLDLETERVSFPDYKPNHKGGVPDHGHLPQFQLLEYYYLTGDPATYDSILDEAMRAVAITYHTAYSEYGNWSWKTHDTPVDLEKYRGLSHGTRYAARPMFVALQGYEITGDERYLYPAKIAAYGLRNVGRANPLGFITGTVSVKDPDEAVAWMDRWKSEHPGSPTPQAAFGKPFYIAIGNRALYKYWEETHDEEIADALSLSADFLEWVAHKEGNRYTGWQYTWADFLSQGRRMDSGRFTSTGGEALAGLVYGYLLNGRENLYRVIDDARPVHESRWFDNRLLCFYEALQRRDGADSEPPAPVTDLSAEPAGPGAVRLAWTAPGDDGTTGTASVYQIKYSKDAPIVPFVRRWDPATRTGWPDLRDPLPLTSDEYYEKARRYTQTEEIAFWAATNVKGEPAPEAPGTRQSMTIEGLSPGTYHFALVTWDGDKAGYRNVSDLSNIATVTVP